MGVDVHNLIEDVIRKALDELLLEKGGICKCERCKLDMVCYSLNKAKPMYVVSSRGVIHVQNRKREDIQEEIDIYSIVKEAIEAVSHTPRHGKELRNFSVEGNPYREEYQNLFSFPVVIGRILDGNSLSVITEAEATLCCEANIRIKMANERWSNPAKLVKQMDGSFSFWPAPIPADKPGIQKSFNFYLEIKKEGYETMCKYFEITSVSVENREELAELNCNFYNIQDVCIFKED